MSSLPPQGSGAAFEDDPDGVRELLRGLPAPGPMPAHVEARITAAFTAETTSTSDDQTRITELLRDTPAPGPMPADVSDRIEAALRRAGSASSDDAERISGLLRGLPAPGPMPAHVEARITAAFTAETTSTSDDQTRITELLRDTPAPGPMPADVSDRIEKAIASAAADRGERPDNVAALLPRRGSSDAESSEASPLTSVDIPARRTSTDADAAPQHRRSMFRLVGGVAAAGAAIAISVGGYQALNTQAPGVANPVSQSTVLLNPSSIAEKVHVTNSDKNYTAASFVQDAGALARTESPAGIKASDAAQLGSVATPEGALSCAAVIGEGVLDDSSKITVDIANYESKPALIVVVSKGDASTAWVLNRKCDQTQAPVAGPTKVS